MYLAQNKNNPQLVCSFQWTVDNVLLIQTPNGGFVGVDKDDWEIIEVVIQ